MRDHDAVKVRDNGAGFLAIRVELSGIHTFVTTFDGDFIAAKHPKV
jgi:hypothetical protein